MKIALVGCGQIAAVHVQEARKLPGVVVAAVCGTNIHKAGQFAEKFGIPEFFANLDEMLECVRPDVVHITSPPQTHLSVGRCVLEHGAHAYVEKPFTTNLAEADELIAIAARAARFLCVGHSFICDPAYLRLKDLFLGERLGGTVHVEGVMNYDLNNQYGAPMLTEPHHWVHLLPGGIPHNIISHPLYLMLDFIKDEPLTVVAKGFRKRLERYGDVRDRFHDELRIMILGKECTASLMLSCRAYHEQLCLVLHGRRAQAVANMYSRTVRCIEGSSFQTPLSKVRWAYGDLSSTLGEFYGQLRRLAGGQLHYFDGMRELFRKFYLAVDGRGDLPVPMQDARRVAAITDEIFRQCRADAQEN